MTQATDNSTAGAMALVLCRSQGSPRASDKRLASRRHLRHTHRYVGSLAESIRPAERHQANLIAMARGYRMTVEPGTEPGWLAVTFVPTDA